MSFFSMEDITKHVRRVTCELVANEHPAIACPDDVEGRDSNIGEGAVHKVLSPINGKSGNGFAAHAAGWAQCRRVADFPKGLVPGLRLSAGWASEREKDIPPQFQNRFMAKVFARLVEQFPNRHF